MGLPTPEGVIEEEFSKPKISIKIQQFCPLCKQFVNDNRFKNHILTHWVKSKIDEEFNEFIRRIYKSKESIDFVLLDKFEYYR